MQLPAFARSARRDDRRLGVQRRRSCARAGAREVRVVPVLFEPERLAPRGRAPEGDGPLVLVVGRLVPNKRHDRVFRAFAAYQRECEPGARLLCVGTALNPGYAALMQTLADASGARNVRLAGGLAQDEVNAAYAEADVLLTLSEHEGFCVPLLEAFHFGAARGGGAGGRGARRGGRRRPVHRRRSRGHGRADRHGGDRRRAAGRAGAARARAAGAVRLRAHRAARARGRGGRRWPDGQRGVRPRQPAGRPLVARDDGAAVRAHARARARAARAAAARRRRRPVGGVRLEPGPPPLPVARAGA